MGAPVRSTVSPSSDGPRRRSRSGPKRSGWSRERMALALPSRRPGPGCSPLAGRDAALPVIGDRPGSCTGRRVGEPRPGDRRDRRGNEDPPRWSSDHLGHGTLVALTAHGSRVCCIAPDAVRSKQKRGCRHVASEGLSRRHLLGGRGRRRSRRWGALVPVDLATMKVGARACCRARRGDCRRSGAPMGRLRPPRREEEQRHPDRSGLRDATPWVESDWTIYDLAVAGTGCSYRRAWLWRGRRQRAAMAAQEVDITAVEATAVAVEATAAEATAPPGATRAIGWRTRR